MLCWEFRPRRYDPRLVVENVQAFLCWQVYLCGDESALDLIEEFCEINNDSLSVVKHERLGSESVNARLRNR